MEENKEGWLRVFRGPGPGDPDDHGTLVSLTRDTTSSELCRQDLGLDATLWAQYGGGASWRLASHEAPLQLQECFLAALGYTELSRRKRMGIDPELRHLLRFHTGPAEPQGTITSLLGFPRAARLCVLKGLVVPRWRRRAVALLGSRLLLFPGEAGAGAEVEVQLRGGRVEAQVPRGGLLVLRVVPGDQQQEESPLPGVVTSPGHGKALFLGFHAEEERDLWLAWLAKATAAELQGEGDSRLCLARSGLRTLPAQLLCGPRLTVLDLRDNLLAELPEDIWKLQSLQEMRVDRNALRELPAGLVRLRDLRTLSAAQNRISSLPAGLLGHMPSLQALSLHSNLLEAAAVSAAAQKPRFEDSEERVLGPLSHVDLRHNALCGSIVLADYGALTSLDVSYNRVQSLDLVALEQLRRLHCSHNDLRHLALSGCSLEVLVAPNNKLQIVQIDPAPDKLQELDLSRNELLVLPSWVAECRSLNCMNVAHNQLTALPETVFHLPHLHTLQAGHNSLRSVPSPRGRILPLQILRVQSNELAALPHGLLTACTRLVELNVSSNQLVVLMDEGNSPLRSLRRVLASNNELGDAALRQLARLPGLRTLHAAHNRFTTLSEACVSSWSGLQELVLSGNELTSLPESITKLTRLQILRLHSNQIRTCPAVSNMVALKVLDLSHNRLEQVDLAKLAPPGLQCLDVSCNNRLHVDPGHFNYYRSQRPMSLVDTTGQNRSCLPASPYHEAAACELPWALGFADAGGWSRLPVCQLRLPGFCNSEALLGVFEGRGSAGPEVAAMLAKCIPRLLLEERTIPETANEFMKYTLLSAHRELRQRGQLSGADASLCHISRPTPAKPYVLRVASVGGARVLLARRGGHVARLTRSPQLGEAERSLGRSQEFPLLVPDPFVTEVVLGEADQFLLVASERLWEQVGEEEAVREVSAALGSARGSNEANVAAKRLVDFAQSYGCGGAVSVLVLSLLGEGLRPSNHCIRQVVTPGEAFMATHARSSPSGQSAEDDQGIEAFSSGSSSNSAPLSRYGALPGFSDTAVDAEDELTDAGSAGAEQLRCWEYMLERNTRVLFDRELQAVPPTKPTLPRVNKHAQQDLTRGNSSRHRLLYSGPHAAYFGSLQRLLPGATGAATTAPVAAEPINPSEMLQYVPEEEAPVSEGDSIQCGNRMQRYWGVATTEL